MGTRNPETHKGNYGHALLVAGRYGSMGCAILSARAALRSGCGLLTVHLPQQCVGPMQVACPEAMVDIDATAAAFSSITVDLGRYQAVAVGPGIGTSVSASCALRSLLSRIPEHTPLVLDADALNILAQRPMPDFHHRLAPVLTPHAREYRRLFGDADPQAMADRHNVVIVAKAHRTRIYAPGMPKRENTTGNAGMATAGSGDVLTGILLGMLAQMHNADLPVLVDRVEKAVWIHGKSGDIATEKQSESSLIASDIVENLKYLSCD